MKQLKLLILAFGALGLLGLLVPSDGNSSLVLMLKYQRLQAVLSLVVFVMPIAMALIALIKPPMETWQAGVSLAFFAYGLLKFRPWQLLSAGVGPQAVLLSIGVVGGVAVTLAALVRRDA